MVLRGGGLEKDKVQIDAPSSPLLEGAHQLRKQEEYAKAKGALDQTLERALKRKPQA